MNFQQDFPFNIRIPEAIPPSITLEKGGEYPQSLFTALDLIPLA